MHPKTTTRLEQIILNAQTLNQLLKYVKSKQPACGGSSDGEVPYPNLGGHTAREKISHGFADILKEEAWVDSGQATLHGR